MSTAQRIMLFALFRRLAAMRGWGPAQQAIERERITREALGESRSWSLCGNPEVDLLKARLQVELRPDSLDAQIADATAAEAGERRRLLHRIESDLRKAQLADSYACAISRDLYDRVDWRDLPITELTNLRDTLGRACRRKRADRSGAGRAKPVTPAECPF